MQDSKNKTDESNNKSHLLYETIISRREFYVKNLRFLIGLMLLGFVTLVFLLISIGYLTIEQKDAWYIPTNIDGTFIKTEDIQSVYSDGKEITEKDVVNWALKAIPSVYNFNFLSGEASFRGMVSYFTPSGYKAYKYALEQEAGILATVKAAKSSVQGSGCGAKTVKVLRQGLEPVQGYSVYTWHLQLPMVVRNVSDKNAQVSNGTLQVRIQRVPRLMSKDGLAIFSFVYYDKKDYDGDADFNILCKKFYG